MLGIAKLTHERDKGGVKTATLTVMGTDQVIPFLRYPVTAIQDGMTLRM